MFLNNKMRPAFAGADANGSSTANKKRFEAMTFDESSDTADFGSFTDTADRTNYTHTKPNKGEKKKGFSLDTKKLILIGIAAALAIITIVSVAAIALVNYSEDIMLEDNAYLLYADGSDKYHVIANGELIEHEFEGEVEMTVAADNSFAYVVDDTDDGDGYVIYILKGKKLTPILSGQGVEEIIALATLEPGIIYVDSTGSSTNYMIYNETRGEEQIVSEREDPENFTISADGEKVAFTIASSDKSDRIFCLYEDRNYEEIKPNVIPVAISSYGDYVYVSRTDSGVTSLLVYSKKQEEIYKIDGTQGFAGILEMNIKGDEVIFYTAKTADGLTDTLENGAIQVTSYLYRYNAKKDAAVTELGANFVTSVKVDPDVAIYKNFKDTYFISTNGLFDSLEKNATYYLNKKYERESIQKNYGGQFSPDGKYFYYVNDDGKLKRMDLNSSNRKEDTIATGVNQFALTAKGNVCYLSNQYIYFYKTSTDNKEKISHDALFFSFHEGSNKLYYSEVDKTSVLVSKEGKDPEIAKLDKQELASVPYFTSSSAKKSYAVVYDATNESYSIFYINGSRFDYLKKVDNCKAVYVNGVELDLTDYVIE